MPEPRVPYPDDPGHDPWESWQEPPHWQPPPQDSPQWQDPQEPPRWRDPQDAPQWQDPHDLSHWQEPPLPQDSPHWQDPQDTPNWQDPQGSQHWRNPPDSQHWRNPPEDQTSDGYDDRWTGEAEPEDNWQGTRWHNPTDDPQWSEPQWSEPQYPGYQHPQDPMAGRQPSAARYFIWRSRKYLRLAGIAAAICIVIGGYALGHFGKSPSQSPGQVTVDQYHAGLCIAGPASLLNLGTDKPWPQFTTQVSCTKPHIAEVVYAGAYWGDGTSFPATQVRDGASAACSNEFQAYVGIPLSRSVLNVDPIVPDATSWSQGSKRLECVAWHSTPSDALGAPLTQSVRGSRK
jgi:Septum formation